MRKFIKIFLVICLICNLNTFQSYGFDRQGASSVVGVYCGELTVDFSSGWNNPRTSYRVIRNELGINVSCDLRYPRSRIYKNNNDYTYYYDAQVICSISGMNYPPIGKMYSIIGYRIGDDFKPDSYPPVYSKNGNIISNNIQSPLDARWVSKDNNFSTNSKVVVAITILDYLWEPDLRRVPVIPRPIPRLPIPR